MICFWKLYHVSCIAVAVSGWLRLNDIYVFSRTVACNVLEIYNYMCVRGVYTQMTILINSQAVAKHKLLRDNAGTHKSKCFVNARDINTFRIMFQFIWRLRVIFYDRFCSHSIIFTSENPGNVKAAIIMRAYKRRRREKVRYSNVKMYLILREKIKSVWCRAIK